MSLIPQCNEFTTMATMMNGLDTIPSHCDKASITLTVAMVAKLLDWANSMASPDDIYKAVENMSSQNLSGVIDIDDWSAIIPVQANDELEPEIYPEPTNTEEQEVSNEVVDGIENTIEDNSVCQSCINGLFDETEPEAQQALKQFQAKFNIVSEEPSIDNPVIEDNGVSPELEDEINQILAIANNIKE